MKDFSKDILHTIEQNRIAPRPRWVFVVRQAALIGGFLLSVLVGGISVSVILFALSDIDAGAGRMMRMHPGPFLITYLPYVWILTLIAFGALAYYDIRSIKGAYRYRRATILGASILLSVIVGGLLHVAGAGRIAERRFAQMVPQYEAFEARKMHLWMRPQEGMLAGSIVSGPIDDSFVLEDFSGAQWTIDASEAAVRGPISGVAGERVRVAGSLVRPGVFRATDLSPWMGSGMMQGLDDRQRGMMHPRVVRDAVRERNDAARP